MGFGLRPFLALILAVALVGVVAYGLLSSRLYHQQVASYSRTQAADARGFEALGRGHRRLPVALGEIDRQIDGDKRRPEIVEDTLIDPENVIRAANRDRFLGKARLGSADRRGRACRHRLRWS